MPRHRRWMAIGGGWGRWPVISSASQCLSAMVCCPDRAEDRRAARPACPRPSGWRLSGAPSAFFLGLTRRPDRRRLAVPSPGERRRASRLLGYDPYPQRDFGWRSLCLSRPLLELVVRQKAIAARVRTGRPPPRPAARNDSPTAPRSLQFIRSRRSRRGTAPRRSCDRRFGRATRTLDLLKVAPARSAGNRRRGRSVLRHRCLRNPGRRARPLEGGDDSSRFNLTAPRGGIPALIERGRWIVSVGGRQDDAPARRLGRLHGFPQRIADADHAYNAVKDAKRVGEVVRYGFRESVWRRFDLLNGLPRGLIPVSRPICRFNLGCTGKA